MVLAYIFLQVNGNNACVVISNFGDEGIAGVWWFGTTQKHSCDVKTLYKILRLWVRKSIQLVILLKKKFWSWGEHKGNVWVRDGIKIFYFKRFAICVLFWTQIYPFCFFIYSPVFSATHLVTPMNQLGLTLTYVLIPSLLPSRFPSWLFFAKDCFLLLQSLPSFPQLPLSQSRSQSLDQPHMGISNPMCIKTLSSTMRAWPTSQRPWDILCLFSPLHRLNVTQPQTQ